jgi:hypothetical protein
MSGSLRSRLRAKVSRESNPLLVGRY